MSARDLTIDDIVISTNPHILYTLNVNDLYKIVAVEPINNPQDAVKLIVYDATNNPVDIDGHRLSMVEPYANTVVFETADDPEYLIKSEMLKLAKELKMNITESISKGDNTTMWEEIKNTDPFSRGWSTNPQDAIDALEELGFTNVYKERYDFGDVISFEDSDGNEGMVYIDRVGRNTFQYRVVTPDDMEPEEKDYDLYQMTRDSYDEPVEECDLKEDSVDGLPYTSEEDINKYLTLKNHFMDQGYSDEDATKMAHDNMGKETLDEVDDIGEYISTRRGYEIYRKVVNGKGIWHAKKDGEEPFQITYDQARGYKPIDDAESLSMRLGKLLTPNKPIDESAIGDKVVKIGLYGDYTGEYESLDQMISKMKTAGLTIDGLEGDEEYGWEFNVTGPAKVIYKMVDDKIPGYSCDGVQEFVDMYEVGLDESWGDSLRDAPNPYDDEDEEDTVYDKESGYDYDEDDFKYLFGDPDDRDSLNEYSDRTWANDPYFAKENEKARKCLQDAAVGSIIVFNKEIPGEESVFIKAEDGSWELRGAPYAERYTPEMYDKFIYTTEPSSFFDGIISPNDPHYHDYDNLGYGDLDESYDGHPEMLDIHKHKPGDKVCIPTAGMTDPSSYSVGDDIKVGALRGTIDAINDKCFDITITYNGFLDESTPIYEKNAVDILWDLNEIDGYRVEEYLRQLGYTPDKFPTLEGIPEDVAQKVIDKIRNDYQRDYDKYGDDSEIPYEAFDLLNLRVDEASYEDDPELPDQEFTSADTSINSSKLPAIFNMVKFEEGSLNLDYGGGKFDNASEYVEETYGATSLVYDPYNRSSEHNSEVLRYVRENGGADTVTCSNVLNVIKEPEARLALIRNCKRYLKEGGTAYFTVYEGSGAGAEKATSKGYQLNRKTADYVSEIQQVFSNVTRKGKLIIAQ